MWRYDLPSVIWISGRVAGRVPLSEGAGRLDGHPSPTLASIHALYGRWLCGQVRKRFGPDLSDDIVQETWLRMAKLETVSAIRHPKAFLLRVAVNSAISQSRRRSALERAEASSIGEAAPTNADQLESLLLRETILSLPQPLRDVFVLSRFGGLTNSQIGEQLGISPKTVEWRMTKALAHCAAQFRR